MSLDSLGSSVASAASSAASSLGLSGLAGGLGVGMQKASLQIVGGTTAELTFSYNPAELSITKTASWNQQPQRNGAPPTGQGSSAPAQQEFLGTNPRKLSMSLTFDARDPQSNNTKVVTAVQTLLGLTEATRTSWATTQPTPPTVVLHWGSGGFPFQAYVDSVSAKYTLFSSLGEPIRAQVQLSLTETPTSAGNQNPTSGGVSGRQGHRVSAGDSLQSVAYARYGRASLWRALAAANQIDNPFDLRPGTLLLVPPRSEAEALA